MDRQAGSVVVSRVSSPMATWSCLILLLSIHLAMNHAAVRAVRMHTLNRQRANIVFSTMLEDGKVLNPEEVSLRERIFERDGVLRWKGGEVIARAKIGVSFQTLVTSIGQSHGTTGSIREASVDLEQLVDAYRLEEYILWYDTSRQVVLIVLKEGVTAIAQLKAWCHALWLVHGRTTGKAIGGEASNQAMQQQQLSISTLGELSRRWPNDVKSLRAAGWDLEIASLETAESTRIRMQAGSTSAGA